MDGRHDDTDTSNGCDIDTDKDITLTEPGLRYPRDFLLADERPEDFDLNLEALAQDLQPRGALERRQVDLIAVADWEGMRHRRLVAALLHPAQAHLQPAESDGQRLGRLHVEAMSTLSGRGRGPKQNFLPEPGPGDPAATADILRAERANMAALEFHQRQAAAAERARRQAVDLLLRMQDRRRQATRGAAVEDAVVVEAVVEEPGCASSGGAPSR